VYATFGLLLETLNGFKVRAYLDVSNETRRLMWTLCHAHGTLLSLVNLVFALVLRSIPDFAGSNQRFISRALVAAAVFLPGGFFLGGVRFYAGDPGIGIVLVPFGAALLIAAAFLAARGIDRPASPLPPSREARMRKG
jgi:hypothetical protein